jgi:hypothetical protein
MKQNTSNFSMLLGISMLAAGCASAPAEAPASTALAVNDCDRLAAEMSRAGEARQAGLEQERNAWKVVLPFAVATRYVSGKSQVAKADRQSERLHAEYERKGCEGRGS